MAESKRILIVAIGVAFCLSVLAFQPMVLDNHAQNRRAAPQATNEIPSAFRDITRFVTDLLNNTDDTNDSDHDLLPDSVELVIGTDPQNPDSDFDGLSDYQEAMLGLNPNKADSNDDRLSDFVEVTGVDPDVDGDGIPNAWDDDNDNDGVADYLDFSPFAKTPVQSSFQVDVSDSGKPTYISFELKTKNPDHMRLIQQSWDWPADSQGSVKDLDGSTSDVVITPSLKITSDNLPSQKKVIDYGIVIDGPSAYVPLFPVWDLGNIVALKGRMFLPQGTGPLATALNVSLTWRVSGITNTETKAFATLGGAYFSVQPDGAVTADSSVVGVNETFSWTPLSSDKAALRAANGMFVALQPNGTIYASAAEMTSECQFTFDSTSGGAVKIIASNGMAVVALPDGRLSAAGAQVGSSAFDEVDLGVAHSPIGLATYNEDFMLTGMTVNENHGTSIGVFSGPDQEKLIATNLLLAYDFLRNSSGNLTSAPGLLTEHDISGISCNIQTFEHEDLAIQASTSTMIPAAVDAIPAGQTLPVIVGLQDSFAGLDLSELSDRYIVDGPLSFDLTGQPVVVSKVLRSSWYMGGSDTPLELYQVIDLMRSWGMSNNSFETAAGLVSAWYCGEEIVTSVGDIVVNHTVPEVVFVDDTLDGILTKGLDAIGHLMNAIKVLDSAYAFSETFARMGTLTKAAGQSTWNLFKTTYNSVKQGLELTSSTKLFERLSTAMDVIAVVIAFAMSLYALFSIGAELGWGAVGTGIAVTYAIVTLAYAIALVVLSSIAPPYGAILAGIIAIVDFFAQLLFDFDFLGKFIGWLVDCFTDTRTRSDVSLGYVRSDMTFSDVDGNGIDVGDNISYTSWLYGNVTITGDGSYQDLVDSSITPHQVLWAPWGSRSVSGGSTVAKSTTYSATQKTVLYQTQAWLRPGIGMVNFPVAVGLYSDYTVYYDDCWWFFGWWCDRKSQSNDPGNTQVSQWTTIYFDVMPGSLDDFYNWRALPSMDSDGDGLNNTAEAVAGTDPWSWDTDADGLGDQYELQIGTDPRNGDTDGDGLSDRFEVARGYNPTNADSDGDRLSDYFEYRGWVVDITYRGHEYAWMVNSEPNLVDTDNDGTSDYDEYFSLLNPRSADTDGDGVRDVATNYYVTKIEYDSILSPPIESYSPNLLAVDEDGMVYTTVGWDSSNIAILNPNGSLAGGFQAAAHPRDIDVLKVDLQGQPTTLIFTTADQFISIYSTDGTRLGQIYIGDLESPGDNGFWSVALDPNGPQPGTYYLYTITRLSHVYKLLMNGTSMEAVAATWGGYGDGPGRLETPYFGLIDVGLDGSVYVWDDGNNRIDKFAPNGTFLTMWGEYGYQDGQFDNMRSVAEDADGNLLTFDGGGDAADRIQKFGPDGRWLFTYRDAWGVSMDVDRWDYIYICNWDNVTKWKNIYEPLNPEPAPVFVDADSDGLTDVQEAAGWNITVESKHGTSVHHVTSDPMAPDTDFDGVSDANESRLGSDPRSEDTDGDKLTDLEEMRLGTNLTNWDTDGDGLSDGQEVKFGSDPKDPDSDHEGLSDYQEFVAGTDPNKADTDDDGLNDLKELAYGSDPTNADTDGDMMFDGQEYALGADPGVNDTDSDGIGDGLEMLYSTNATSGDSDGDHISDGFEVSALMSPLSNDTDGDGVNDSTELERGLNPLSGDSDGDGVPDSLDKDYQITLDGEIVLACDDPQACASFISELGRNATVRVVSVSELLASHTHARYIVLVGDPLAASGTSGGLIHELLADSGDVLEHMTTSEYERMAVRYGLWSETQTVVMLSHVYSSDAIRVIGVLKSMRMSVSAGSILVDYLNPRACFRLDQIDATRVTDTFVWGWLGNMTTFNVSVERLNDTQVSPSLSGSVVLSSGEVIMDRYVRIEFQRHDPGSTSAVMGALVKIYYTAADLDLNGDGDSNGSEDLNEASLELFVLGSAGSWMRLSDIVNTTGVNTTDLELYGKSYAGYMWANVSSLSLFGIAGLTYGAQPTPEELYDELRQIIHGFADAGVLNKGRANSLLQKVNASENQWQKRPDGPAASNVLEALVKETLSLIKTGVLTQMQGDSILNKANEIWAAIQPP